MAQIEQEIVIKNAQGLHARPAAMFVQIVSKYNSDVTVQKDDDKVDGRSIMGILTLGAQKGTKLLLSIDGDDALSVLKELMDLLNDENF